MSDGDPDPDAPSSGSITATAVTRPARPGLFLARDTYRQRRLRDAARMLPVLGIVIWLMPLLWRRDGDAGGGMGTAVVFLFAGWTLLIVLTALIARRLSPDVEGTAPTDDTP